MRACPGRVAARTPRSSAFAPARAKATGRPCAVHTRCRPRNQREWLAQYRTVPIRPGQSAWRSPGSGRIRPGWNPPPRRHRSIRWQRRPGRGCSAAESRLVRGLRVGPPGGGVVGYLWAPREAGQSRTAGAGGARGRRPAATPARARGSTSPKPALAAAPWMNRDAPSSSALQIEHYGAAEKDHPHHLLPHRQLTGGAPTRWHERDSGGEQKAAYGQDELQPLPPIARGVSGRIILGQHAHQTNIHKGAGISIPRTSGSTAGGGGGLASLCCAGIGVICCRMAAPRGRPARRGSCGIPIRDSRGTAGGSAP